MSTGKAGSSRKKCEGGCGRVTSHGREFCPVWWRRLPADVQEALHQNHRKHVRVTKQVNKSTMKIAKRLLGD
jgi:hypothetical protein